jgi:ribonucleoside-diphosphate reductase alpha chain
MNFIKSREYHYYYSSSYLTRFFQEYIGITKAIAKNKKIPQIILRSSKEVVKAFLQGMFDGDGCAYKTGIKYTSTSKELVSQLQILLLNFGIQSYIRYTEEKTSKTSILTNKNHITKIYNLFIKNQYIERFFDEIGFRLSRKKIKKIFIKIN